MSRQRKGDPSVHNSEKKHQNLTTTVITVGIRGNYLFAMFKPHRSPRRNSLWQKLILGFSDPESPLVAADVEVVRQIFAEILVELKKRQVLRGFETYDHRARLVSAPRRKKGVKEAMEWPR